MNVILREDQLVCHVQGSLDAMTMDQNRWAGPAVKGQRPKLTGGGHRVTAIEPGRGPKTAMLYDNGIVVVDRGGSNTADRRYYQI